MRNVFVDPTLQASFEKNGYVLVPNFLTADEVADLQQVYLDVKNELKIGFHASLFNRRPEYREAVNKEISRVFARAVAPMFDRYVTLIASFAVKEADPGSECGMHQDLTFLDESKYHAMGIWAPLVDVNETNGALEVMPGSHRWLDVLRAAPFSPSPYDPYHGQIKQHLVRIPMKAGDAIIYDNAILHFSQPNRGTERRVVATSVMIPEEAKPLHYFVDLSKPGSAPEMFEVDAPFYWRYSLGERPSGVKYLGTVPYSPPSVSEAWIMEKLTGKATAPPQPNGGNGGGLWAKIKAIFGG